MMERKAVTITTSHRLASVSWVWLGLIGCGELIETVSFIVLLLVFGFEKSETSAGGRGKEEEKKRKETRIFLFFFFPSNLVMWILSSSSANRKILKGEASVRAGGQRVGAGGEPIRIRSRCPVAGAPLLPRRRGEKSGFTFQLSAPRHRVSRGEYL